MILDTNALSDWWLGKESLLSILERAPNLHLAVPVLAEFRFGVLKSRRRAQMEIWLREAQTLTRHLPADEDTAEHYAHIRYSLEAAGTPIPMNDLWIAAIARQHRLPIVSRDTHFDLVPEIKRLSW